MFNSGNGLLYYSKDGKNLGGSGNTIRVFPIDGQPTDLKFVDILSYNGKLIAVFNKVNGENAIYSAKIENNVLVLDIENPLYLIPGGGQKTLTVSKFKEGVLTSFEYGGVYYSSDGTGLGGGPNTQGAYSNINNRVLKMVPYEDGVLSVFENASIYYSADENHLDKGDNLYGGTQKVISMTEFDGGVVTAFDAGGVYYSGDGRYLGGGGVDSKTKRVYLSSENQGITVTYVTSLSSSLGVPGTDVSDSVRRLKGTKAIVLSSLEYPNHKWKNLSDYSLTYEGIFDLCNERVSENYRIPPEFSPSFGYYQDFDFANQQTVTGTVLWDDKGNAVFWPTYPDNSMFGDGVSCWHYLSRESIVESNPQFKNFIPAFGYSQDWRGVEGGDANTGTVLYDSEGNYIVNFPLLSAGWSNPQNFKEVLLKNQPHVDLTNFGTPTFGYYQDFGVDPSHNTGVVVYDEDGNYVYMRKYPTDEDKQNSVVWNGAGDFKNVELANALTEDFSFVPKFGFYQIIGPSDGGDTGIVLFDEDGNVAHLSYASATGTAGVGWRYIPRESYLAAVGEGENLDLSEFVPSFGYYENFANGNGDLVLAMNKLEQGDGLRIYFPFDDSTAPSGGAYELQPTCDAVNVYTSSLSGTAGSGAQYIKTTANGGAYKLNGVDSFFESIGTNWIGSNPKYLAGESCLFERGEGNNLIIDNTKSDKKLTLSVWVKLDSYPSEKYEIVQKYNSYGIKVLSDGSVVGYIWGDNAGEGGVDEQASTTKLELGQWYNLVLRFNGKEMRKELFINGKKEVDQVVNKRSLPNEVNYVVRIGAGNNGVKTTEAPQGGLSGQILSGSVDELRVYSKALTDKQVARLALTKYVDYSGLPSTFQPKVAYWHPYGSSLGAITAWDDKGSVCYYNIKDSSNLYKWRCDDRSGWTDVGLPVEFIPSVGYYSPFDGKIYLWNSSGALYYYNPLTSKYLQEDKSSWTNPALTPGAIGDLPKDFVPATAYYHPFANNGEIKGAINLWSANGSVYFYNPNTNKYQYADKSSWANPADEAENKLGDLPQDFIPKVAYWHTLSSKSVSYSDGKISDGAITLIDAENNDFYYYPDISKYRYDDKSDWPADLGLSKSMIPILGYYHTLSSMGAAVDLWSGNTVYEVVGMPGGKLVSRYVNFTLGSIISEGVTKKMKFDNLPKDFKPVVGFYYPFLTAASPSETIWVFDSFGNLYFYDPGNGQFNNGVAVLKDFKLPSGFRPVVGYYFPFGGLQNAFHLWDANGQLYIFNHTTTSDGKAGVFYNGASLKTELGLPSDFKPVKGYYSPHLGKRVYLWNSNGSLYIYTESQGKFVLVGDTSLESLGIKDFMPETQYYYPFGDNDRVDLWNSSGSLLIYDNVETATYSDDEYIDRTSEKEDYLKSFPLDKIPTLGYYHNFASNTGGLGLSLWIGKEVYELSSADGEFTKMPVGVATTTGLISSGFCSPVAASGYINPVPVGTRVETDDGVEYCDPLTQTYIKTLSNGSLCFNDYQCESNACVEGTCQNIASIYQAQANLLKTIYCWVSTLFDGTDRLENRNMCLCGNPAGCEAGD